MAEMMMCSADGKSQIRQCLGFVQLIHRPTRTKNQLYKNPNIANLRLPISSEHEKPLNPVPER